MSTLLFLGLWLACAALTVALVSWLFPEDMDEEDIPMKWLVVGLSPIAWPLVLVVTVFATLSNVVIRSKTQNLRVRAELEKELAAARKEIDDFIKSGKGTT